MVDRQNARKSKTKNQRISQCIIYLFYYFIGAVSQPGVESLSHCPHFWTLGEQAWVNPVWWDRRDQYNRRVRCTICACAVAGSSVSLGADLLSIYDDARHHLDDVTTNDAVDSCADYNDGDSVEMLPAEEHGIESTTSPERPSATAAAVQRAFPDVDERSCKRPLSVSSTSSSMSSTSSLPRHERKKLATAVQSLLPGVDDASPGCGDNEAGCLSTVAELVPAVSERRRLSDAERSSASLSCPYVEFASAAARDDDDTGAAGCGGNTRTLSRSQYVDRVVAEIIDTERAYVDDLEQIIHVCYMGNLYSPSKW